MRTAMPSATNAAIEEPEIAPANDTLRSPPPDWPLPGAIDLSVHDLPHDSSTLEWWYVNSHFETDQGRRLSLFAAFFRHTITFDSAACEDSYTHSVVWAISDPEEQRYHARAAVNMGIARFGLWELPPRGVPDNQRISRALCEVIERGPIPSPTRKFARAALGRGGQLKLNHGGDRLFKQADGCYRLQLYDDDSRVGCDLVFRPEKPPTRHGDEGVVHGMSDESMFYYFVPRCAVSGVVLISGKRQLVQRGLGWYEHEFGYVPQEPQKLECTSIGRIHETSWCWASVQLDTGVDLSVYIITRLDTGEVLDNWTIISDAQGRSRRFVDARLEPCARWHSARSCIEYPIGWQLDIPSAGLFLHVTACIADQEVITILSDPGF